MIFADKFADWIMFPVCIVQSEFYLACGFDWITLGDFFSTNFRQRITPFVAVHLMSAFFFLSFLELMLFFSFCFCRN